MFGDGTAVGMLTVLLLARFACVPMEASAPIDYHIVLFANSTGTNIYARRAPPPCRNQRARISYYIID